MVKEIDYEIVVCEFKLQSRYCDHFGIYTLGKGVNSSYSSSYELNSNTILLLG